MRSPRLIFPQTFSLFPNRAEGIAPGLIVLTAILLFCLSAGTNRLQAQQNEWTWVGGNSSLVGSGGAGGQAGVYGTLGTASASNAPGGRQAASTWTDSSGNFWLFGGQGFDATDASGNLNDLWMFSPSTTQWTWISGSSTVGATGAQSGVYGTLGTAAASNHPGGRYGAMSWIDASGNLWLFGGFGYDANGTHSDLNDLWEFSPSSKQWTWMGGSTVSGGGNTGYGPGQPGVYGTLGSAVAGNIPGGRGSGSTWTDNSGNFWLFGGWGYDTAGNGGALNDLWEFSPTTKQWTWMGGSSTVGTSGGLPGMGGLAGVYGTQGTAATGNLPGSRSSAITWKDQSGNFWLFGGEGVDGSGSGGYLNDLWEFSPTTRQWTWVGGSSTVGSNEGQPGIYGSLGTPAAGNIPGGRSGATSWTDSSGNLWLQAGYGFDAAGRYGYPNDVWEFNPTTKQWAWMGGSNTIPTNQAQGQAGNPGVYGVPGTANAGNIPGSRMNATAWTDNSGNLWLFGGWGKDASSTTGELNDLWKYQPATTQTTPSPAATPTFSLSSGTYSTVLSVTISDTTPNPTIYYTTDNTTPTTNSAMYTGSPITVLSTETIQAIATANGYTTSAVGTATYTIVSLFTPTVTVAPAPTSITTAQALTVTITVNGGTRNQAPTVRTEGASSNPTPTGSVTLNNGSYNSGPITLSGGSATITVPAGSLATGTDTLTATYTPDSGSSSTYNSATGSNTVTVAAPSVSFVSNVGTAEAAQLVTVNITTAGTPSSIQVLTQGLAGLDFTGTSGGTCTTATAYTVSQTCTVNVVFKPLVPGARPGAVLLTDASNDILGTAYLPGTGIGPQITFNPGVQSMLPDYSGQNAAVPTGVAVDSGLNVYVADLLYGWIIKMPWTGSAYGAPVQLPFTGLNNPEGVAVDGAGDVFVADFGNSRVVELPWNGSSYGTQIVLASYGFEDFPDPTAVAVDSHGNLFFVELGYSPVPTALIEMPWTGSGYGSPTTITAATGLNDPYGLAVDANLNIYIADYGNSRVVEIPWNGTSFGAEIVVASGIGAAGVAVDGAGDVYIANGSNSPVVKVPWNGTAFGTPVTVPFALGVGAYPYGIAVDDYGNLYVSTNIYQSVLELNVSTPPSLSFANSNVGSVSSDSPQKVAVSNIGNAPLNLTGITPPSANFVIHSSTTTCSTSTAVAAGGSCVVGVDFIPSGAGALAGTLTLTDNSLNVTGATQPVHISGTGTGTGPSTPTVTVSPSPSSITTTQPTTVTVAVAGGGSNPTPTGSVILSGGGYTSAATTLSSGSAIITVPAGSLGTGTDTLTATYTPDTSSSSTYNSATGSNTVTVTSPAKTTPTVTVSPSPSSITSTQPTNVTVTVAGGGSNPTPTGSVILSGGGYTSAATTLSGGSAVITVPAGSLATGTDTLTATYTPDSGSSSTYNSATGSNTVTVTAATVQVTVGTSPAGLSFTVDSTTYTSAQTLSWTVGSTHTIASTSQQVSAGTQNTFTSWSDAGALSHTVTASSSVTSYTATFSTSYQLTPSASPLAGGGVTPTAATYYPAGTVVNLTATPNSGYTFSGWTGNVASAGSASTTITMNAPQSVTANFTSTSAIATLTPPKLTFTAVTGTTSASQVATLTNTGTATLNITGISITGANPTDFAITTGANACGTTLAIGASCSIYVTFTPASATSFAATLLVADNANVQAPAITRHAGTEASQAGSTQSIALVGNGTAPATPAATLTPPTLTFISTTGTTSASQVATLANTGTATLNISGITITGTNPSDFAITTGTNACGTTLAASSSCSIYVTFTPASAASFSATLSVADNASGPPQTTALSGTGTAAAAPAATLTPPTLTFTSTAGTTSSSQVATLSNTGNAALTITGITIAGTNPSDFAITTGANACGTTLAASASCSIYVTFTPASAATFSATLSVADNASGSPQTTALGGTGTAAVTSTFTVSSTTTPQTVQPGSSAQYTITVAGQNGAFSNPVTLAAIGLPTGATATFSPASVTPGSTSANSTLTIQTAAIAMNAPPKNPRWPLTLPVLALISFLFLPGKRGRRWLTMTVLLIASLGAVTALTGCGGGFGLVKVLTPTTYNITVTGTSGSTQQSTTIQLTVQ